MQEILDGDGKAMEPFLAEVQRKARDNGRTPVQVRLIPRQPPAGITSLQWRAALVTSARIFCSGTRRQMQASQQIHPG